MRRYSNSGAAENVFAAAITVESEVASLGKTPYIFLLYSLFEVFPLLSPPNQEFDQMSRKSTYLDSISVKFSALLSK